jgi:hypothetical protein
MYIYICVHFASCICLLNTRVFNKCTLSVIHLYLHFHVSFVIAVDCKGTKVCDVSFCLGVQYEGKVLLGGEEAIRYFTDMEHHRILFIGIKSDHDICAGVENVGYIQPSANIPKVFAQKAPQLLQTLHGWLKVMTFEDVTFIVCANGHSFSPIFLTAMSCCLRIPICPHVVFENIRRAILAVANAKGSVRGTVNWSLDVTQGSNSSHASDIKNVYNQCLELGEIVCDCLWLKLCNQKKRGNVIFVDHLLETMRWLDEHPIAFKINLKRPRVL